MKSHDFWALFWAYLGTIFFTFAFIFGLVKQERLFFVVSYIMLLMWLAGVTIWYHKEKMDYIIRNTNIRYCKKCKSYEPHIPHGFAGSNYRETCYKCDNPNYTREGL
jgi:hypothetical protein